MISVEAVANTIFPRSLYQPHLGAEAAEHLYRLLELRAKSNSAAAAKRYIDRLVAFPGPNGPVNQLRQKIAALKGQLEQRSPKSSIYEVGVHAVGDGVDLNIYLPERDRRIMGFPCLSHISLTLEGRRLHMTAIYRNQHFVRKAYGNYLGLGWLLAFLSHEVGCESGELFCVATHASAELRDHRAFTLKALRELEHSCQSASGATLNPTVLQRRSG